MTQTASPAGHHHATDPQVLRASAGTGKTFQLSNRYLHLLYRGAHPRSILATTFTRKAAGEILQRVLTRLAAAAADENAAATFADQARLPKLTLRDVHRMLSEMAGALHRVSIATIDSFFHRMADCFRYELGLPTDARIVAETDPAAARIRRQAIDAMLADDEPQALIDLLRRVHHDQAARPVTDAIVRLVANLYDVYCQSDQRAWSVLKSPESPLGPVPLADAIAGLENARAQLPNDKNWARAYQQNLTDARQHNWPQFISRGLAAKAAAGQSTYRNKPLTQPILDAYAPLIDHARATLITRAARRTQAIYELLARFDQHFRRLRRRQRIMLFADLPRTLAHDLPALGDDVMLDIYFRLDARVGHLMLDEFQDTSVDQWNVLRPFALEIQSQFDPAGGEQASSAAPARTFFCVGDVKQAIYGWRGGCAEIFAKVERDLNIPDQGRQTLSDSYRSAPVVLNAVNAVFGSITTSPALANAPRTAEAFAACWQPHKAHFTDRKGYVELSTSPRCEADDGDDRDDADGDDGLAGTAVAVEASSHLSFVADKVAALSRAMQRATPDLTVGVLVRKNKTVRQLIYLLRRMHIDASGEGGTPVTDDPAVSVVLSALTLADHPGHRAALFHVLHSPLADVLGLESRRPPHVTAAAVRSQIADHGFARTLTQWSTKLAPACDQRSAARLTQLIELADRYEPPGPPRIDDFIEFVHATPVDEPAPSAVRVMTIHKAKGLEFDAVVLGELDDTFGRMSPGRCPVWTYRDEPTGPITAVFAAMNKDELAVVKPHCTHVAEAHEQQRDRRLWDDLCALYVAMTRARCGLYMAIKPLVESAKGGPTTAGTTNQSYATVLRNALSECDEAFDGGALLYAQGDKNWFAPPPSPGQPTAAPPSTEPALTARPIRLNLASSPAHRRTLPSIRPSAAADHAVVDPNDLLRIDNTEALERGRVIHACFEAVTWLDQPAELPADEQLRLMAARAAPAQSDTWRTRVVEQFKGLISREHVQSALARPAGQVELWRERAFAVIIDAALVRGTFDRVVIDLENDQPARAQIIDFKTDVVTPGNRQSLIDQYRPQLQLYRKALGSMLHLPDDAITARLLFVTAPDSAAMIADD